MKFTEHYSNWRQAERASYKHLHMGYDAIQTKLNYEKVKLLWLFPVTRLVDIEITYEGEERPIEQRAEDNRS